MLVEQGRLETLRDLMGRRIVARALAALWLEDEPFRRTSLTPAMLTVLIQAQRTLSTLTLLQLVNLYFKEFDRLDGPWNGGGQVRQRMETVLQAELEKRKERRLNRPGPLTGLAAQPRLVFGAEAPRRLVEKIQEVGADLNAFLEAESLQVVGTGRFFDLCQAIYFLETLKNIPLGSTHPVLKQLQDPAVNTAPFDDGRRIGHAALEIVIDRSDDKPSDAWLRFVVDVAGDPRVVGSRQFSDWWKPLGTDRINRVRGWLSKVDIDVFLEALEDYSRSAGREDIGRMLPARKRFIQGLSQKGRIKQARLALGRTVEWGLRRRLGSAMEGFAFARFLKNDTAIIVLDCHDFFIVEGSHSFKIWVYLANPADGILFDYTIPEFTFYNLIHEIPAAYAEQFPGLPSISATHDYALRWQHNIVSFLARNGISLDAEDILTPSDYHAFIRRFPVASVSDRKTKVPEAKPMTHTKIRTRVRHHV
jgi:hypothetical protein